jgi:enhancing lycopene biosynthesis protein 2
MDKKRIGVLLSGCGVKDGAEIHEAVLTLAALDRADAEAVCMAPDRDQMDVIDHLTGKPSSERRNILTESARIARGRVKRLSEIDPHGLDGIVIPGGFGAAKNLCTFARDGADCTVDPEVAGLLRGMHKAGKPIAALCIAPVVLAALFGKELAPEVTIGTDAGTSKAITAMGARHKPAATTEVVVDGRNRMVTTPCYMSATRIREIEEGTENAVRALLALVKTPASV